MWPMHWERECAYCWSDKKLTLKKKGEQQKEHKKEAEEVIKGKEILIYRFFKLCPRQSHSATDWPSLDVHPPPLPPPQGSGQDLIN